MALDATRLANAIAPDLESLMRSNLLEGSAVSYPKLTAFCQSVASAIASKVVAEITANAALNGAVATGGTFTGSVSGSTCTTTISNRPVSGGII